MMECPSSKRVCLEKIGQFPTRKLFRFFYSTKLLLFYFYFLYYQFRRRQSNLPVGGLGYEPQNEKSIAHSTKYSEYKGSNCCRSYFGEKKKMMECPSSKRVCLEKIVSFPTRKFEQSSLFEDVRVALCSASQGIAVNTAFALAYGLGVGAAKSISWILQNVRLT